MVKHILFAILLGVSMAACLSQTDTDTPQTEVQETAPAEAVAEEAVPVPNLASFVIAKGRVGNVRIGMPIEDMRSRVAKGIAIADTTLTQEGTQATAYLLHPQNEQKGILVEQTCEPACRVWRISVHNARYKTMAGIGIGSKYGEVQQAYPITYLGMGEGNFVAVSEEAGLSFILDVSQLPREKLAQLKPTDVPANTQVKGMLIY
ncbi:mechanosensitive ion channel protein MscS [Pontibacter sp. 172403-2]|nr:mechanosensitive ion channel protein MscS [Pontibacter sp. 172403-2]